MPAPDVYGLPTTTDLLSKVSNITVDAVLSERHTFTNLVTAHPVEDGSPVTDHIINLPIELQMEGRITDTPLSFLDSAVSGAMGLVGSDLGVDPVVLAAGSAVAGASLPGRAKLAYQELVALYVSRTPFTVISGINEYDNMVFESLDFPRAPQDGRSLRFRATLKEIIIVGVSVQSNADIIAESVQNTAVEPNNRGTVPNEQL